MTIQEISDRLEIMELLTDYCTAIDKKDIEALDRIFQKMPKSTTARLVAP